MSGERKPIILFDQELTGDAGTIQGNSFYVGGHAINVTVLHDALSGSATFTLRGGPGKADLNAAIYGETAAGLALQSGIAITGAAAESFRVGNPPMWVQVVIVDGSAAGRVRVTAVVEVDQN